MKIACDGCGKAVDESLLQISDKDSQILYLCPECYLGKLEEPPEQQP